MIDECTNEQSINQSLFLPSPPQRLFPFKFVLASPWKSVSVSWSDHPSTRSLVCWLICLSVYLFSKCLFSNPFTRPSACQHPSKKGTILYASIASKTIERVSMLAERQDASDGKPGRTCFSHVLLISHPPVFTVTYHSSVSTYLSLLLKKCSFNIQWHA